MPPHPKPSRGLRVSVVTLGCDKNTVDSERYGEPPVDANLEETLCEGSALFNTTFRVHLDGLVYERAPGALGTHHVTSFDGMSGATNGWIDVTLTELSGGEPIEARLEYTIQRSRFVSAISLGAYDMCAPPW